MKSIKERKKLRKVKKKWVVVSAGIWVGLLSTIVAAANPQLIPKSLRQFFPESRVEDLKANPNVQSILHEAFGEQVLDQTGQSIKLNDSVIQQLNEIAQIVSAEQAPDLDGAPEMNLDGQQPDMYLNRQQIEDIVNVVTSEDNHDATPQQILQSAAEIVLDKSEQEPERLTPEIQKVVEHVEKVIELPSVDALEKAEQLKEAQAKADALLKEQEKRDAEIRALNETVENKEKIIELQSLDDLAFKKALTELDQLQNELEEANLEKEKSVKEVELINHNLLEHQNTKIKLETEIALNNEMLEKSKEESSKINNRIKELNKQLSEQPSTEEHEKIEAEIEWLEKKVKKIQKENQEISQQILRDQKEVKLREEQIKKIELEKKQATKTVEQLNHEIELQKQELQGKLDRLKNNGESVEIAGMDLQSLKLFLMSESNAIDLIGESIEKTNGVKKVTRRYQNSKMEIIEDKTSMEMSSFKQDRANLPDKMLSSVSLPTLSDDFWQKLNNISIEHPEYSKESLIQWEQLLIHLSLWKYYLVPSEKESNTIQEGYIKPIDELVAQWQKMINNLQRLPEIPTEKNILQVLDNNMAEIDNVARPWLSSKYQGWKSFIGELTYNSNSSDFQQLSQWLLGKVDKYNDEQKELNRLNMVAQLGEKNRRNKFLSPFQPVIATLDSNEVETFNRLESNFPKELDAKASDLLNGNNALKSDLEWARVISKKAQLSNLDKEKLKELKNVFWSNVVNPMLQGIVRHQNAIERKTLNELTDVFASGLYSYT